MESKIWHKWFSLWNRKGIMDRVNRPMVVKEEGVGRGVEWEMGVSRCKLLHIEWVNNKVLLCSTDTLYPMINRNGKDYFKTECIYVCVCVCVCTCVCAQSCLTLWDPMDCSPPVFSVYGIFQEYWRGLPFPTPGDLPDLGIKSWDSCISCISKRILHHCAASEAHTCICVCVYNWITLLYSIN